MIGYALCGSYCTHSKSLDALSNLIDSGKMVIPIISENVKSTNTRFGSALELTERLTEMCGMPPLDSIQDVEPLGPKTPLEALIISPCTGNTLAKMALGITDTSVSMAAKAHLRADRPLIIALASNDAMSANLKNISTMLNRKNVYFVPMIQDDYIKKPHSLVADFTKLEETFELAMSGKQIRPLFI